MSAELDRSDFEPAVLINDMRRFHATGATNDVEWRLRQLDGILRLVAEREDEVAAALEFDLGRPAVEAWLGDIAPIKAEAEYARKHLRRWMKPKRQRLPLTQRPGSAWIQYEPLGVVLVIGPWNYPVLLTLAPLIAAVAAGNCAVVKPSELAPATAALLAHLIPLYLDPQAISVVEGDGRVTQDLLGCGFDRVFFTGGTEVGRKIMAGAAPTLTPVTLELGGKSPVVVADDADLDVAARRIAWIKFLNSGQTCIAPDYLLVDARVKDALIDKVLAVVDTTRSDFSGDMRIVNRRQFDRLAGYIDATRGRIMTGGGYDPDHLTIEPTVIADPDPGEPSMTDEIFGPILPVMSYESIQDAIAFVNSRPKPLAVYVFSKSNATARRVVDAVPAGGAVINHAAMHCLAPTLPFGGVGASGMGSYHGKWGFQEFSHRKAVLSKPTKLDPKFMYPPYSERAKRLLRRVL